MQVHSKASWAVRDDRRTALVWLGIFWIIVGLGFGFDLHNYLHEQPPVPIIVHVHAIATTIWLLVATVMVLTVETGNVPFHRRFGWFASGYAAVVIVIAIASELSWQALNMHTPGDPPPEFLAIAFGGPLCFAILLAYGILLRRNLAAHRRVMILAAISISDAGFSRLMSLFMPEPTHFLGTYLYFEGGNLLIILLMFAWDWKKNRIMKQFLQAAALVIAVDLTGSYLFYNATWKLIARSWLLAWAAHVAPPYF
jgi:hypothetical protein